MADSSFAYSVAVEDDDSEWEYEYHDTETESFYVTLDLSSANNQIRTKKKASPPPAVRGNADGIRAANIIEDLVDNPNITTQERDELKDGNDLIMSNPNGKHLSMEEPEERIQILGLHTSNPIISYQDQIYSCKWTSTIGTDLLLSTHDPDFPHPVLKEEPGVSIIAATGIKLFGRPIKISSRPSASAGTKLPQSISSAPESSTAAANEAPVPERPTPIKIPAGLTASKAREKQAKFLERLVGIKAAKAEKDEVTIHSQKPNEKSRWRNQVKGLEERQAREAQDAEPAVDEADIGDESAPATPAVRKRASARGRSAVGRSRRASGRRRGPRTKDGGLFRDYGSQVEGAHGGNNAPSAATPERWDQLDQPSTHQAVDSSLSVPAGPTITPPTHPPQVSSPKTAPAGYSHTRHPHATPDRNLDPDLSYSPPRTQIPATRSEGRNGYAGVASGCGVDGPSPIDPEGRRNAPGSVGDGEGMKIGTGGGAGVDVDVGVSGGGDVDGGNADELADVDVEMGDV